MVAGTLALASIHGVVQLLKILHLAYQCRRGRGMKITMVPRWRFFPWFGQISWQRGNLSLVIDLAAAKTGMRMQKGEKRRAQVEKARGPKRNRQGGQGLVARGQGRELHRSFPLTLKPMV